MIYLKLKGRIGNQLFMYANAYCLSKKRGKREQIVIDERSVKAMNYKNSLREYPLENVVYLDSFFSKYRIKVLIMLVVSKIDDIIIKKMNCNSSYYFEEKNQKYYNKIGLIKVQDGYIPYEVGNTKNVFLDGYFQSTRYFSDADKEIKQLITNTMKIDSYPNVDLIKCRNSVCISIKVEDNINNEKFYVCTEEYYRKAIKYICEKVDNPLFFVCSDDVEYVKKHFIDTGKYLVIEQDASKTVEETLLVMSCCKHFIISNSSFAWWAQHLSKNNEKIVVAPSKWYGIVADWQWDIYEDGWVRIDV